MPGRIVFTDNRDMKLTVIGGGSVRTPQLIPALIRRASRLGLTELWLMDIDAEKLDLIGGLCRQLATNAPFSLHFTTYIWFDRFFDVGDILKDIVKRPFITVGFAAFVLLIPLAVTSNNAIIKKLGAKLWQRIHYLVYLIAVLAVIHYWWLVKKDLTQPIIYAVVFALLLGQRVFWKWHKVRVARA